MSGPSVAFRADASFEMGSGHVMRCLTLADALRERGHVCHFVCRAQNGHLAETILRRGHEVHLLSNPSVTKQPFMNEAGGAAEYAKWLGVSQGQDAVETAMVLDRMNPQWLVVDHYALDAVWEQAMAGHVARIMIIDDLANRPHNCHLLLDQTFGRDTADYAGLVPDASQLLCGSSYALLRPGFAALRPESLRRRRDGAVQRILVSMGGVDADNVTGRVLAVLHRTQLPEECQITVVMGPRAPWLNDVKRSAAQMRLGVEVLTGVEDMARLMADCDLAIGAAGATSWERCCLGLPTVMVVVAENQRFVADGLVADGAAVAVSAKEVEGRLACLVCELLEDGRRRAAMSARAARVTSGHGVGAVVGEMEAAYAY